MSGRNRVGERERRAACDLCKKPDMECTLQKAAHVPLYAWACDDCYDEWVSE